MWLVVLAVVLGGAAISLQAPINAALARELGAPVPAGTDRTKQSGFTPYTAIRDGRGGPAMRPELLPRRDAGAVNSVGELAAE